MRVVVATWFPRDPACPVGGVEAVSVTLVRALANLSGLDVQVVTTDRSLARNKQNTWGGITVHRLASCGRWMLTHALRAGRRQMRDFLPTLAPDVVHAHDTYGLMIKGLAVPRVFTVHGFIHADTVLSGTRFPRLRSLVWRRVETAGWADQPHVISISPYVRERLSGIARGVIHDIDNPISEAFFDVPRQENEGTIFSAGVICPRKNTLCLLETLARLRAQGIDATLRLAGATADERYARRLRARIEELGLRRQVTLLGPISSRQMRDELARASVFALVSLEEGAPMVIEEAMAVGVPVVASNRCGIPYLVRHHETGYLVDPRDPDDISWRLATLLRQDDLRTAMSRKAREVALDRFHPNKVALRTRQVYLRAIRDHERRAGQPAA